MLHAITKTMRFKAAIFMVALYAFTVLAPHAAMAFGLAESTAHCLTQSSAQSHDHAAVTHKHADGLEHSHAAPKADEGNTSGDEKGPAAACCGLFSATAMPADSRNVLPGPVAAAAILAPLPDLVHGQGPASIIRPPIL